MKGGDGYQLEQMNALAALVRRSSDVEGLATSQQGRAQTAVTESGALIAEDGTSVEFMKAVAISIVQEEIRADREGDEAKTASALSAAGCPVEMWIDLGTDPDFQDIYEQVRYALIDLPRLARRDIALTNLAASGDVAAFKALEQHKKQIRPDLEDALKEYNDGERGRTLLNRRIEMLMSDLVELQKSYATVRADDSDIMVEAQARIDEVNAPPDSAAVDHRALFLNKQDGSIDRRYPLGTPPGEIK